MNRLKRLIKRYTGECSSAILEYFPFLLPYDYDDDAAKQSEMLYFTIMYHLSADVIIYIYTNIPVQDTISI